MNAELKEEFAEVIAVHGEELFGLVWNAGMAGEAIGVLAGVVDKHRSRHGLQALGTTAAAFNEVAELLRAAKGWTAEDLAACDTAIKAAFAAKVVVPRTNIILH